MKRLLLIPALVGGLMLGLQQTAEAHCDSLDGPVATTAVRALATGNVNLVLPYAPAAAETEIGTVFAQALDVRAAGGKAKTLADRAFIETVVRLHRAGEGAPYTGVKPSGLDFGPAIPAAEQALESGDPSALEALLVEELRHAIRARFAHTAAEQAATKTPETHAAVEAARQRVSAELAFIGFAEGLHLAVKGEVPHAE